MAEMQPPFVASGECLSPQALRVAFGDLVCGEGVALHTGDELQVTSTGASSPPSITIAAGGFFVLSNYSPVPQGVYHGYNDAAVVRVLGTDWAAADGTNPRIDTVVAHVIDNQFEASPTTWAIEVIAGTPTPGATLANLAGASATINTDTAVVLAYLLTPAAFAVGPYVNATHILDARQSYTTCGGVNSPYVHLEANAAQSPATGGAYVKILLGNTVHNDSAFFSVTASVVTILRSGLFDLQGWAPISTGAGGGFMHTLFQKNGLSNANLAPHVGRTRVADSAAAPSDIPMQISLGVPLVAGDTIQYATQISGPASAAILYTPGGGGGIGIYGDVARLVIRKVA